MKHDTDCIIVGAGPAGAVTALLLARAGVDVLLLDRSAFPRAKPCGDCLSLGATPLLASLGLLERVRALPHAALRGWRIVAPDGSSFEAAFDNGAAMAVDRALLDCALLHAATDAGVRFMPHAHVQDLAFDAGAVTGVRTRDTVLRAPLTIGADGLRSIVAARLRARTPAARRRKLSLTWHVQQRLVDDRFGEMHCGDGVCFGIAPVLGDASRTNVTMVADTSRFGRDVAADAAAFALAAAAAMPRMRGRLEHDMLRQRPLASGPFDRPVQRIVFDGAALAGDAAGYFDPFTGQGVYQAIAGASLLAPVAAAAVRSRDTSARALAPYAAARRHLMRQPRLLQYVIEAVLARPALAGRVIRRISAAPAFARAIVAATGDTAAPVSLLSPLLLSTLLFPAHMPESSA